MAGPPPDDDKRTPLEAYVGDVRAKVVICRLEMDLAMIKPDPARYQEADQCIEDAKKVFRQRYEVALKTVKKPAARNALKEHLIGALTTVSSTPPKDDETKSGYAKRQADLSDKLVEKWARFEVEN